MNNENTPKNRLPLWLKRPMPKGPRYQQVLNVLDSLHLATVCSSASCPNRGECYSHGTATFMIMGDICTRNCRFCGVNHGEASPLQEDEPARLAQAVRDLKLKHVVITSVTRDDLPDKGAKHFARVIKTVRSQAPQVTIEVLTPDFLGISELLDIVHEAQPDVFNHNLETCRRLTPIIRSGADYQRSLDVLRYMSGRKTNMIIKSGFMLGLGELDREIVEMLTDLRGAGVEMITIGQYLRPGKDHYPVQKYYRPEEFEKFKLQGEKLGFSHVAAGPFVRSSYHADISLHEAQEP